MVNLLRADRKDQPALLLTPSGRKIDPVSAGGAVFLLGPNQDRVCLQFGGRLSPDGKRLVGFQFAPIFKEKLGDAVGWMHTHLWMFDLESTEGPSKPFWSEIAQPQRIEGEREDSSDHLFSPPVLPLSLAFGADGRKVYVSEVDGARATDPVDATKPIPMTSWEFDFPTSTKTSLALPADHSIADVSFDGKTMLTQLRKLQQSPPYPAYITSRDGGKPRPLCAQPIQAMRFSPDGKQVIGVLPREERDGRFVARMAVVSVADGSLRTIPLSNNVHSIRHACFSPDGKRIAYDWIERFADGKPAPDSEENSIGNGPAARVSLVDLDGRNTKTILRCETGRVIQGLDWR